MPKTPSISLFGFSVTDQRTGYTAYLRDFAASENAYSTVVSALGGASAPIIPYIFSRIPKGDSQYIIFEIATSLRFAEAEPQRYKHILYEIAQLCFQENIFPAFINMYRINVDYRQDKLSRAISEFCEHYDFPLLDLAPKMVEAFSLGQLSNYLHDGTHTTSLGAEIYAKDVHDFILGMLHKKPSWTSLHKEFSYSPRRKKFIMTLGSEKGGEKLFRRSGMEMPFIFLEEGSEIDLVVPLEVNFDGLFFIIGPRTGRLELSFDVGKTLGILAYDKAAYYERMSYKLRPIAGAKQIKIRQVPGVPNVPLRKGLPNLESRVGKICGFMASSDLASGEHEPRFAYNLVESGSSRCVTGD